MDFFVRESKALLSFVSLVFLAFFTFQRLRIKKSQLDRLEIARIVVHLMDFHEIQTHTTRFWYKNFHPQIFLNQFSTFSIC